jgi:hypothetical protein
VAAAVAVPLALGLGMWVGTGPSNTVRAVVPALLVVVLVPPLAVVGVERWWSRRVGARRLRTGVAVGAALGAQVLLLGALVAAGTSAHRYGDAVLLTLLEALVLPLVVTLVAYRNAEPPSPSP